jgi:hypothetical protein
MEMTDAKMNDCVFGASILVISTRLIAQPAAARRASFALDVWGLQSCGSARFAAPIFVVLVGAWATRTLGACFEW